YQHDDYELFHTFLIFWSNSYLKYGEISEIQHQNLLKNLHIFGTDDKFFIYSIKPKPKCINAVNNNNNVLLTPKRYITVRPFHPDSAAISDYQVRQQLQVSVVSNFLRAQLQITII